MSTLLLRHSAAKNPAPINTFEYSVLDFHSDFASLTMACRICQPHSRRPNCDQNPILSIQHPLTACPITGQAVSTVSRTVIIRRDTHCIHAGSVVSWLSRGCVYGWRSRNGEMLRMGTCLCFSLPVFCLRCILLKQQSRTVLRSSMPVQKHKAPYPITVLTP